MSRLKQCAKCEVSFECSTEGGCWCNDAKVDKELLKTLWLSYSNCLCPKCLAFYSNNPEDLKKAIAEKISK